MKYVRLRRFDTATEAGRSAERHRRIALAALASAAARMISIGTALITVPLTLNYLGVERYGMLMTMSALTAMLSFADFGIGNGLLSAIASASGRDDRETIRRYLSSAFVALGLVMAAVLAALASVYGAFHWEAIFNVSDPIAQAEAAPMVAVFICCFALSLPLSVVQNAQLGLQMGFAASLWQCLGSVFGLLGVLAAIHAQAGLPWLVAAFSGGPVIALVVSNLVFFTWIRPDLLPRSREATRLHMGELMRLGGLFFVLQVAIAITFTSDNLVIAQKLGPDAVAHYAITDRMFSIAAIVVALAVTPLWPAFGEALARGDRQWARLALVRATHLAAVVSGLVCLVLVLAGPVLLQWWVGDVINPPVALLVGLALWRTIEASNNPASMYLNASHAVRFQIVIATALAVSTLMLKLLLIERFGVAIVPWTTLSMYLVFVILPTAVYLRRTA